MAMTITQGESLWKSENGFTLIELLIVLAITSIVAGTIISVFISQQDSYKVQIEIVALHQNLRTAMDMITEDIRMAGYYTCIDTSNYDEYIDWNPVKKDMDEFIPLINGVDGVRGITKYRDNSDIILIVKASKDRGVLKISEGASAGENILNLKNLDLDGDGDEDLNSGGRKFGVLMKSDLSHSEIFKVVSPGPPAVVTDIFRKTYGEGDYIARADIVIYRVDDKNGSFAQPVLERKNFGNGNQFQVVSEGISDLQIRYVLDDSSIVEDPSGEERNICAIMIELTGVMRIPGMVKRRFNLESMIEVRNKRA
jgi:prepilin-type N-terminal cleavage/methylation domain-containing protein